MFLLYSQVYSPGADDIMAHPGDGLSQSHYSPKGGIYADAYYMGKSGLSLTWCLERGPLCFTSVPPSWSGFLLQSG